MPRDLRLRIADILGAIARIERALDGVELAAFRDDPIRISAVAVEVMIIGEAASQVPGAVRDEAPDVPWAVMRAMRNRLTHEYYALNADILFETAVRDIPLLTAPLNTLLARLDLS